MMITPKMVVLVLLMDAILWGIWFGGLWSYRSAFASRLTDSYLHISISTAMPLAASSITYIAAIRRPRFFREHRLKLFKISILVSRILYLLSSLVVYIGVLNGVRLLYIFSMGLSISYAIGTMAGIAWTDYVADNIPEGWKPRYIALDSTLSTVGALIGTAFAGVLFARDSHIYTYGRLFLVTSLIFLTDIPLITLIKEFKKDIGRETNNTIGYSLWKRSKGLYIAITLLYVAINLPSSLIAPYILYELRGDEMWIAMINGANFIASIATPIVWGEALRRIPSLALARIAIVMSVISIAVFPYIKSLELQILRSFVAGAGGIGIWMSIFSHIVRDVDAEHRIPHSSTIYIIQSLAPAIAMNLGGILAEVLQIPETVFLLTFIGLATLPMIKTNEDKHRL